MIGLTEPILEIGDFGLSWRDLVLGGGGLFLIVKGTREMHQQSKARMATASPARRAWPP